MSIGIAARHTMVGQKVLGYIDNDLVAMYDGEYNAGLDLPHDPSATVWKDLVGGG